jgi:hypothetical protein
MPAKSDPRAERAVPEYFYRRSLSVSELLPIIGVGVAAGIAAFYLARLYRERTPLVPGRGGRVAAPRWRLPDSGTRDG